MTPTALLLLALQSAALHGTVRADSTLEPLAYATVEIPALGRSVSTNAQGYYVLSGVPTGRWEVRASALGHSPVQREVELESESVRLDFHLPSRTLEVSGITVQASRGVGSVAGPGAMGLDARDIRAVPVFAETDVLRAVEALPSVTTVSDFSSALYVRGGAPDQNLFLLDGTPIFNPYHLGGMFSAFNPEAVSTVDVLAGAAPARVGDRLSSLVDVRLRDGGRDRLRGSGAIGLYSSRATLDGPLPGRGGSYLVSGRRTYGELLGLSAAASAEGMIPETMPHGFGDLLLKGTHGVGGQGSVSVLYYADREWLHLPEHFESIAEYDWSWGSRLAGVHYRQPIGSKLLLEARAGESTFSTALDAFWADDRGVREQTLLARGMMRDRLAGADVTWYGRGWQLRGGVQHDRYLLEHHAERAELPPEGSFEVFVPPFRSGNRLRTTAAYAEQEVSVGGTLRMRGGVRLLHAGGLGSEWLPRFGARLSLTPAISLTVGGGRYAQALHSIRDEEAIATSFMAYDLLAATPAAVGLARGEDLVVGAAWEGGFTTVRVDAYAKRMRDLALPPLPPHPARATVIPTDEVEPAHGEASGVELLVRHVRGEGGLWVAYALAHTEREAGGERYVPRFHRHHLLDAMATVPVGRTSLGVRTVLRSGQPYTPELGWKPRVRFDPRTGRLAEGERVSILQEHNSARMPAELRVDLSARATWEKVIFGASTELTPYLQVVNALHGWSPGGSDLPPGAYTTLRLPFLFTLGLEWKF